MEFRRINGMPPYVFTIIDGLKVEARGEPVVEQQRNFVRGGGGEQVIMHRTGFPDAAGWIRLMRARMVLGETDAARAAQPAWAQETEQVAAEANVIRQGFVIRHQGGADEEVLEDGIAYVVEDNQVLNDPGSSGDGSYTNVSRSECRNGYASVPRTSVSQELNSQRKNALIRREIVMISSPVSSVRKPCEIL